MYFCGRHNLDIRMNFAKERIKAHNKWPKLTPFKAEEKFETVLADLGTVPFRPIILGENDHPDCQRCVGHLLDALEAMPKRPDLAFDACFRILDLIGTPLYPNSKLKGLCQGLPTQLIAADNHNWNAILDQLTNSMPLRTLEFLAKRLLTAPRDNDSLNKRAKHAFGQNFHDAFLNKFAPYGTDGKRPAVFDSEIIKKAALLLKLYLSGKKGTRPQVATKSALDLASLANVPDARRRTEVILSLLLFMTRNERAHGNSISPFRTSKATVSRYQSYYFIMLSAYVFALALMNIKFQVCDFSVILAGCMDNITIQKQLFES